MLGVWANGLAVIMGGALGCLLRGGLKEKYSQTINYGLALCVMIIGIGGALKTSNSLVVIISVVVGSVIGELLRIESGIERLGKWAQSRFSKGDTGFAQWAALRLEAMSGYKLPHGYAVAIGIALDTAYAQLRGLMSSADRDIVCGTLEGCGAMDGAQHSRHLLSRADAVLQGLETWRFVSKSGEIAVPKGLGRHVSELPDIATMKQALDMLK